MRCVSVVIADRQPVVLCGLTTLLHAQKGFNVVASCSDGTKCIQAIRALSPDIAVLDISLPGLAGPEILAAATSESLRTRVIFLTASAEDRRYAGCEGAYSVISKEAPPEIFVYCLRQVAAGRRFFPIALLNGMSRAPTVLTERECQIMELVSKGLSNKEIGRRLSLYEGTIKIHLHHIYHKLGIKNRTMLATVRHQVFETESQRLK